MSSRFTPTSAAARVASSTLATNRPAGFMASISAGVLSSITAFLSMTSPHSPSSRAYSGAVIIRRAFSTWQFIATIALPIWLFVGWGVFSSGGWGILGLFIAAPIAFLSLGAIALLVSARPTVRAERAVSWLDIAVIGAWQMSIIGIGFFGSTATLFTVLAVLLAVVAFWSTLWQLFADGARRMKQTMAEFERQAAAGQAAAGAGPMPERPGPVVSDDDVIIVREVRRDE